MEKNKDFMTKNLSEASEVERMQPAKQKIEASEVERMQPAKQKIEASGQERKVMVPRKEYSTFMSMFFLNILYVNPGMTMRYQKKKKVKKDLYGLSKKIIRDVCFIISAVMIIIYGNFFVFVDYTKTPYVLDMSLVALLIISFVTGVTYLYNVLYESKDMETFMSLPVREKDVYFSKLLAVAVSTIPTATPVLPLFIAFFIRMDFGIPLGIIFGVINTVLFWILSNIVQIFMVQIMSSITFVSRHRKGIEMATNIMSGVITGAVILYIQYINHKGISSGAQQMWGPISKIMKTIPGEMFVIAVLVVISLCTWFFHINKVGDKFYEKVRKGNSTQVGRTDQRRQTGMSGLAAQDQGQGQTGQGLAAQASKSTGSKKDGDSRKRLKAGSVFSALWKYNSSFIKEQTVVGTSIITPVMMVAIMTISLSITADFSLEKAGFDIGLLVGMGIGFMLTVNPANMGAIIYSIEGNDYEYLRSFPIDRKKYFNLKRAFVMLVTSVLPMILMVAMTILLDGGVGVFVGIVMGYLPVAIMNTTLWMVFDLNHLLTERENISELYTRVNKGLAAIIFTFTIIFIIVMGIIVATLINLNSETTAIRYFYVAAVVLLGILAAVKKKKVLSKM